MLLCTFPMLLCTFLVQLHRPRPAASSSTMPPHRRSPSGKLFRTDCRFAPSLPRRSRQLLPLAARTSSSATAPRPAAFVGCPYQQLRYSAPVSNKPHPAEKSTPVWLAIWRTWAGFANSQLLSAAFRSIYLYLDGPIPLAATLGCCYLQHPNGCFFAKLIPCFIRRFDSSSVVLV